MDKCLPIAPLKIDRLKTNITYGQLQKMTHVELSEWVDATRLELLELWDKGIPPYQGMDEKIIQDKFSKLKDFKSGVSYFEDELYSDYKGFLKNFSKMANGVNQFFPALLKSWFHGKSIYDYLSNENLIKEFKYTIVQKVRFDKIYTYTKYIISRNKDDYKQFIDWVNSRSDDIKFWIENWNFNSMNEKLNRLKLNSDEVERLRQQGVINVINENNHDGFNDIDEKPQYYAIRFYDKTLKVYPKMFQILRIGLNQVATNFPTFTARWIYQNYIKTESPQLQYKVYDSSMGWGGRMLGALCSKLPIHYVGTDVNMENKGNYEYLGEFYNKHADGKNTYEIHYKGSEEIGKTNLLKDHVNDMDLVFTSPPYFDRELYSDDEEQSCIKYPKYKDWLEGFLHPTLETCYDLLKPNRNCLINIADIKSEDKRFIPLEQDTIQAAIKVGFKFKGKIGMVMTRMIGLKPTDSKNYWVDTRTSTSYKIEPILIFRKEIVYPLEVSE